MADVNVIQPANLDTTPSGRSQDKPIASGDSKTVNEREVTQAIERKEADMRRLESQEAKGQVEQADLDSQMQDLNLQLEQLRNYLRFEKDDDTERMVIFVKNSETDEVIRQIPSQEFLRISKRITDYLEMRQQLSDPVATPPGLITHEKA